MNAKASTAATPAGGKNKQASKNPNANPAMKGTKDNPKRRNTDTDKPAPDLTGNSDAILAQLQKQADEQANIQALADNQAELASTIKANSAMSFAVQQLSNTLPAPNQGNQDDQAKQPATITDQPATPPAILESYNRELAELQARHNLTPAQLAALHPTSKSKQTADKQDKLAKPAKVQQNGVTRPALTTTCGLIWAAADEISAQVHGVCPIALLKQHKSVLGINDHTVKTQYARWRLFNGIKGRLQTIHAVHQEVAPFNPTGAFGDLPKF